MAAFNDAVTGALGGYDWREKMLPILLDFQANHHTIIQMIGAIGWAIGMFTVLSAIFQLKRIGEETSGGGQVTVGGVFIMLIAGICMLHLPSVIDTGTSTFFGASPPTAFAYTTSSSGINGWSIFIFEIVKGVVQALGVAAIINGLIHFKKLGEGIKNHAAKGWWHIIGGVLAWDIGYVVEFLQWGLGWKFI